MTKTALFLGSLIEMLYRLNNDTQKWLSYPVAAYFSNHSRPTIKVHKNWTYSSSTISNNRYPKPVVFKRENTDDNFLDHIWIDRHRKVRSRLNLFDVEVRTGFRTAMVKLFFMNFITNMNLIVIEVNSTAEESRIFASEFEIIR